MKKILGIIFAFIGLIVFVPYASAGTIQFQVNTLSGGSLTTGLVSYYNMQGSSFDYYGSNNGTDSSVTYSNTSPIQSYYAIFNNNGSSYINVGSSPSLTPAALSVSAWIKGTSWPNQYNTVWGGRPATLGTSFNLLLITSGGKLALYVDKNGSPGTQYDGTGINTLSTGVWYNVVMTYDSTSGLKGYVNGALDGSAAASGPLDTTAGVSYIGDDPSNAGTRDFNGNIDEVGIWNRVLNTTEISDLYNGGAGQTMCNGTGGPVCAGASVDRIIIISMRAEHFTFT